MKKLLLLTLGLTLAVGLPQTAIAGQYDLKEMTPQVSQAVSGRQGRFQALKAAKTQGQIGENKQGLVSQRSAGPNVSQLVSGENRDRMVIYRAIVQQNNLPASALGTVQEVFAEEQRGRAAKGESIQLPNGQWTTK